MNFSKYIVCYLQIIQSIDSIFFFHLHFSIEIKFLNDEIVVLFCKVIKQVYIE